MKMKMKTRLHRYGIYRPRLDMNTNIVTKKVLQYNDAYVY